MSLVANIPTNIALRICGPSLLTPPPTPPPHGSQLLAPLSTTLVTTPEQFSLQQWMAAKISSSKQLLLTTTTLLMIILILPLVEEEEEKEEARQFCWAQNLMELSLPINIRENRWVRLEDYSYSFLLELLLESPGGSHPVAVGHTFFWVWEQLFLCV